jgi:hypothetical protein
MMAFILLILFSSLVFAGPCGPHEVYVREQWIKTYTKSDGTKVSAHSRDAHCREIERSNFFQDSSNQKFTNIKAKIKKWNGTDKSIVEDTLALLPPWLSKYHLKEILRGDVGGHPLNPAASFSPTRTLLIFDRFFKELDKRAVVIHEMAHIAFPSIDPTLKFEFGLAAGWNIDSDYKLTPPSKLLMPDSKDSIEEDLTNHIEIFYSDPSRLMTFNSLAFLTIKKIIESKENDQ